MKVFREAGSVAIVSDCFFVLFKSCGESPFSLSDIHLITVRAG